MKISKIQTSQVYKKIIIIFSIGTAIIFGLIMYFSFSKTTITVSLIPQDQAASFSVKIASLAEGELSPANTLDGFLLNTEMSDSKKFENTNTGESVEAQAAGFVTIINNWSQTQPLAATTRLLTPDGRLFRIKERIDVPAGSTLENVEVYADQPGASGNIEPTTFTIPGLWPGLQEQIYAESAEAMTGGLREAKVVTTEIVNTAKKEFLKEISQKAKAEFEKELINGHPGHSILDQAILPIVVNEEVIPEIGTESGTIGLSVDTYYIAVIFDESELMQIATSELKQIIAQDEEIYSTGTDGLQYSIEAYDFETQTATLDVKFTAPVVPRLSNPIFNRDKISGLDEQEVTAYFSNYDEIGNIQIHFSPFWVTKVPSLKDHIEIKIQE